MLLHFDNNRSFKNTDQLKISQSEDESIIKSFVQVEPIGYRLIPISFIQSMQDINQEYYIVPKLDDKGQLSGSYSLYINFSDQVEIDDEEDDLKSENQYKLADNQQYAIHVCEDFQLVN